MNEQHTPEPWCYGSFHRLLIVPVENGHPNKYDVIADLGETEFPYNANSDSEIRYNNARRIVACVNACAGLSTQCLEETGGGVKHYIEVIKQRDELLALLERASVSLGSFTSDEGWSQADMDTMDSIDSVIAKPEYLK